MTQSMPKGKHFLSLHTGKQSVLEEKKQLFIFRDIFNSNNNHFICIGLLKELQRANINPKIIIKENLG